MCSASESIAPVSEAGTTPPAVSEDCADVARPVSGHPWILDCGRDLLFFVASPLLLMPLASLLAASSATDALYLAVFTLGGVGHQLAGFLRVTGDREWWGRHATHFLAVSITVLALGLGSSLTGFAGLSLVLLAAGFWHVLTQQYGFLRIYDAKIGSFAAPTVRLDFLMCFCWFGAGVFFSPQRLEQLLRSFYGAGGPLLDPVTLQILLWLTGIITTLVTILFVMNHVSRRRRGEAVSLIKLLTLTAGCGFWWFTGVNVKDWLLGLLLFELFHVVQYLALVRAYGARQCALNDTPRRPSLWLLQPGFRSLTLYLAAIMIFGIPAYLAGITPTWLEYKPEAGIVIQTVAGLVAASTLLHYYCDGLLWRLREPSTGRVLQLLAVPASDGRVWPWRASAARAARGAILLLLMLLLLGLHGRERARPEDVSANLVHTVPMSWHAHAHYGEQLLAAGERPRAVEHLLQALELHPDAVEARCTLGRVLRQLGDFAGALQQFEEAVMRAPRSVTARAEFGKTLFAVGRLSEGREQLQRAVQLAPRRAMAHYELAVAEMESGNYAAALTSIDRALELDGNHAMLYHLRGRIRGYLDDLPRALTDFERALTLNPSLAGAYRDRAGVFYLTGDLPRALRDINKAIELEVTNWRNLMLRGDVYYQRGDFGRARDDYAAAMASCGRDPEPAERMISLLTQCPDPAFRQPDQAMALAHALCRESGYADVRSLQVLAEACAVVGYYDEAVYWQNQALRLAPAELQPQLRQRLERFKRERAEPPSETGPKKADVQPDNGARCDD